MCDLLAKEYLYMLAGKSLTFRDGKCCKGVVGRIECDVGWAMLPEILIYVNVKRKLASLTKKTRV